MAPSRLDQPGLPDSHEQVAKRRGVQDARVVDDDEARSVAETQLLRLGGELCQDALPLPIVLPLVLEEVP